MKIKKNVKIIFVAFLAVLSLIGVFAGCKSQKLPNEQLIIRDSTIFKEVEIKVPKPGNSASAEFPLDSLIQLLKEGKTGEPNKKENLSADGKMNLQYWIDELGKVQIRCKTQDEILTVLAQEITRIRNEKQTVIQEVEKTPFWNYILFGVLGAALIISLFKR
ncbi:hypothetical protein ACR777_05395 [Sphingobacterium spiritivorum]|uniref:hypothetical protein n=1 Tax=Sphingobacterium spiritivorum TaxID=258 RepID=UPI003DA69261